MEPTAHIRPCKNQGDIGMITKYKVTYLSEWGFTYIIFNSFSELEKWSENNKEKIHSYSLIKSRRY